MRLFSKSKNEKGFTIVEVLISLTIFSIAVTGIITVAVQGTLNVNATKDKIIATYLAGEGLELMRAMRDTTVVNEVATGAGTENAGWTAFVTNLSGYCTATSPCDIDGASVTSMSSGTVFPSTTNIITCGSGATASCPLYYAGGLYSDVSSFGAPASPFRRAIVVTPYGANDMHVASTVTWMEGTAARSATVSEDMFNWY